MYLSSRALPLRSACAGVVAAILGCAATPALAADGSPGLEALETFRDGHKPRKAVENRFFLKGDRFEISPSFGYVPNNPFSARYLGGAVIGYHFSETISAQAQITYSPDRGEADLKALTSVLLDRAHNAGGAGANFQQPLDKVGLAASFGLAWAPVYGKINLVGETVLNFDVYGVIGGGMVSKSNYVALYDEFADPTLGDIVRLEPAGQPTEVSVGPMIGIGQNYFLNQMMAFKIDARATFYVDHKPQYDPDVPVAEQRLYNHFIVSTGLAFFFPKMKPRLYNF